MRWPWTKPPVPQPAQPERRQAREPRFTESSVAMLRARERQVKTPFKLPDPLPGVLPKGEPKMAMDWGGQDLYAWANNGAYYGNMAWLGYGVLAELSQRAEYRLVSETYAKEMTRKWVKLTAVGKESKSDKIKALTKALKKFKVQDCFRRAAEIDGFFGRAHIYIDTGYSDDAEELKTALPINPQKITKGGLKGLKVVEPIWTYPGQYNTANPLDKDFYNPVFWWVMGTQVDSTRLLTFVGREMPDLLKPAYMFGGLSRSQMIKPYVDFWLRDRTSVSNLINNFSKDVIKTDLSVLLQDDVNGVGQNAGAGLLNRMAGYAATKNNDGVIVLNRDTEDFVNVSTPLGTLDQLQAQAQEHMASAAQIPLVKLFGITPSGLNASSDGEVRTYYDSVEASQRDMFDEPFEKILQIIQLSEFGEIDSDISHEFFALWSLDEAGKAAVQKTKSDIAAVAIESGAIAPEEERERLATDPESIFAGLDLTGDAPGLPEQGEISGLSDPSEKIENQGAEGSQTEANSGV